MQGIGLRPKVHVSADRSGVIGHAGARLLADLADATGLSAAYSAVLRPLRPRGTGHDPGRIATDLAVMLADGGEAIADLAVLRDQPAVLGPAASTPTAWRLLAYVDDSALASLASARARAREVAWLQAAEHGEGIPAVRAAGRMLPGLVLDLDATLVTCHSEKEQAAPPYKGGFGFHPLLCFLARGGGAKTSSPAMLARLAGHATGWHDGTSRGGLSLPGAGRRGPLRPSRTQMLAFPSHGLLLWLIWVHGVRAGTEPPPGEVSPLPGPAVADGRTRRASRLSTRGSAAARTPAGLTTPTAPMMDPWRW
ncbi:transposase [Streptomyces europaeiscabiei]|uniref:transposase n=1 Tax=Streptomyces europaeiscabiei TaxID=146819 RepID=UPI00399B082E